LRTASALAPGVYLRLVFFGENGFPILAVDVFLKFEPEVQHVVIVNVTPINVS
jgi:hypothetical protein